MNRKTLFLRMRHSAFFMTGIIGVGVILLVCLILPLFVHWDPLVNDLRSTFLPPQGLREGLSGHVFGTDSLGRDLLIRLLKGGQYSMRIALLSVILSSVIGVVTGLLAGYFGGWIDTVIMRLCDVLLAIPAMILAIAILAVLGASEGNLIFVMTFSSWVSQCKIVRNEVRVLRRREFIMASEALGAKGFHIMFRQIFPNTTTNLIILSSQRFGMMILVEAGLSFLGLGIRAPAPSWGGMIAAGRIYLTTSPQMIIVPGIALMLTVLSFNFLGDGLRDILDTKRKV
jgi:peptide/nickel transport system permease protein